MTAARLTPQPIPIKDGGWWIGQRLMRFTCPECQGKIFDRPAVMAYKPELDPSGDERRYGNYLWTRLGWLIWFECGLCGWSSMDETPERQRSCGDGLVIEWSHRCGPWVPLEADTGPKGEPVRTIQGRQPIPDSLRGLVYQRDGFACRLCGARQDLAIDHIHPVSKGGSNDLSNLQTLCRTCNSKKGASIARCAGCGHATGSTLRSRCARCALGGTG